MNKLQSRRHQETMLPSAHISLIQGYRKTTWKQTKQKEWMDLNNNKKNHFFEQLGMRAPPIGQV